MEEEWRSITGYEGLYEVSNTGKIKSLDREIVYENGRKNLHKGREIKPTLKKSGYYQVSLNKDNKRRSFRLHRLVAMEFVENPKPDKYDIVNHIDGNKTNNNSDNLEWTDNSGNMKHAYANGLLKLSDEEIRLRTDRILESNKRKSKPVAKIDPTSNEIIETYESLAKACKVNKVCNAYIKKCASGEIETLYGYKWKFI